MLARIVTGAILWAVPYAAAIPLLPLMRRDPMSFKAIMVLIGSLLGALISIVYFMRVRERYLRESLLLAATWLVLNWGLDLIALVPFSGQSIPQYVTQLGIEYIGLMSPVVAIGYLLEKKAAQAMPAPTGARHAG